MINNPIIFYIASSLLIIFVVFSLTTKNIIKSLLFAILGFFSGGLIFYILGAEYNAIIQALIYGLAIPIIIGISIMFSSKIEIGNKNNYTLKYSIIFFNALFILLFLFLTMISINNLPDTFNILELNNNNCYSILFTFAKKIFIDYVYAFELISLLLTIVIAGLTLFKKKGS